MARMPAGRLAALLAFVLVSFAANSLVTRYVVTNGLLDPGLLTGFRMVAGALALLVVAWRRRDRLRPGRAHLVPTVALGVYAVAISYGYRFIGAAAGTFVFYATVMLTLIGSDLVRREPIPPRRWTGAAISFLGILVLTLGRIGTVTVLGVGLLGLTGAAWGVYTAAGRTAGDPRIATTTNFVLLSVVLAPATAVGLVAGLHVSLVGAAWAVVMGAGTTAFAYVAWYAAQRSLSGTTAGSVQLAIPVLTTIGAVALLGENLPATLLVAAVLVAGGLWLNRPGRPAPTPSWSLR